MKKKNITPKSRIKNSFISSIKGRLILSFSIMIFIALMVVGFTSIASARQGVTAEAEGALSLLATGEADFVGKEIEASQRVLGSIAEIDSIKEADWNSQRSTLESQLEKSNFTSLGIMDLSGNTKFTDGRTDNLKDEPYITKALEGEVALSEIIYSDTGEETSLLFAMPIEQNGNVKAVLLGERDGEFLSEITDNIKYKEEGYGYIINGEGTNIANPARDMVTSQYNAIKLAGEEEGSKRLAETFKTILSEENGINEYNYDGEDFYAGHAPIPGTDWKVIINITASEVLEIIPGMENKMAIYSIIILILSIIATYIVGERITRPISLSVDHLEKIAGLDISEDLPEDLLKARGEIGILARSIESITLNLRDIMGEIDYSSGEVASTSQQLTASSQQSAVASEEVVRASEDIANGAGEQAVSTERGASMALELEDVIKEDQRHMKGLYEDFEHI